MASKAFRRVAAGAALAGQSAAACDARGELEEAQSLQVRVQEAKPQPQEAVVLLQPSGAKAAPAPSARTILEAQDEAGGAVERSYGAALLSLAERQRQVLHLGANLAKEPAVQEAVMRQLGLQSGASESQWAFPSLQQKAEDTASDGGESLGLGSLPSSLEDDPSPGAFFSDHWCFRSEDFYLDRLETDDQRGSPSGQDAGERAAAPLVLEDGEMAELVHRMQQELERKNAELAATASELAAKASENQILRRRLRTAGVAAELEDDDMKASEDHGGPGGPGREEPCTEDPNQSTYINAALGVAAILIMLAVGRRGNTLKSVTASVRAAAAWIQSVVAKL